VGGEGRKGVASRWPAVVEWILKYGV
jgi:hypothetical protein